MQRNQTKARVGIRGFIGSCAVVIAFAGFVGSSGCGDPDLGTSDDDPLGEVEEYLTKCQPGAVSGKPKYCSDPACPCVAGEGTCNRDSECSGGSICGVNIGARFDVGWTYDFCVMPHCMNGIQDNGETGIDCGTPECGACKCPPVSVAGCSNSCKCSYGQGHCRTDLQCEAGLYCAAKTGEHYGLAAVQGVCLPLHCKDKTQNNGELGVDCGGPCPPCKTPPVITDAIRVSVSSSGAQANDASWLGYGVSADGSRLVFASPATNLVPSDTNGVADVFMHSPATGATVRVSTWHNGKPLDGGQANGASHTASISDDGRYVAFISEATNLVTGSGMSVPGVFVKDLTTGAIVQLAGGNAPPTEARISGSGTYVVFSSEATDLVPGDTNGKRDIFVVNRITKAITRISVAAKGVESNGDSDQPSIDGSGTWISFRSTATNLVVGDTNGVADVFVKHRTLGYINMISVSSSGLIGNSGSSSPSISANGTLVAFRSNASNLVADDTNKTWDIFLRDITATTTTRVSVGPDGVQSNGTSLSPWISPDGRYIAFASLASNLVHDDLNEREDIFVRDMELLQTSRVAFGNNKCEFPVLSAGGYVLFRSDATDLVPGDTNGVSDMFLTVR